jgi:hypothetical protein
MIFSKKTAGSQKQPANKMISDTLHAALKQLPQPIIPLSTYLELIPDFLWI